MMLNPQTEAENFSEIGGYTIVEKLREGGMASLYLATRGGAHGFSRPVAIKVMHEHIAAQPRMTQMFVDEALLGSHLQHPNIGHIEEFGEEAGRYFLVMEYIDGCSISDFRRHHRLENQPMKPLVAAYIISQAAKGLHHAHGATDAAGQPLDVVHRDVSPGNLLVSRSGHVKVIDFGVAKSELRSQHTVASLKGKFRYMSPEQARGQDLDPRSDVYCLGLVLWELLSNRRAIQGKSDLQLLESARSPELRPVTDYVDVSEEFAAVVQKALAVDPDERWRTALEFSQAIRAAMPEVQDFDPAEVGAMVKVMPRGGRSHVTLASSSELSKSVLSRSQSRSELRQRDDLIPVVDVDAPEDHKRRRLIIGALVVIAAAIFLLFAIPSELETNGGVSADSPAVPTTTQAGAPAPQPVQPSEVVAAPQELEVQAAPAQEPEIPAIVQELVVPVAPALVERDGACEPVVTLGRKRSAEFSSTPAGRMTPVFGPRLELRERCVPAARCSRNSRPNMRVFELKRVAVAALVLLVLLSPQLDGVAAQEGAVLVTEGVGPRAAAGLRRDLSRHWNRPVLALHEEGAQSAPHLVSVSVLGGQVYVQYRRGAIIRNEQAPVSGRRALLLQTVIAAVESDGPRTSAPEDEAGDEAAPVARASRVPLTPSHRSVMFGTTLIALDAEPTHSVAPSALRTRDGVLLGLVDDSLRGRALTTGPETPSAGGVQAESTGGVVLAVE